MHRDLTPRNIQAQSDQAKLIDFGLFHGPTTPLAGTAPFVPPELVRTMSLDGRGDFFRSVQRSLRAHETGAVSAKSFDRSGRLALQSSLAIENRPRPLRSANCSACSGSTPDLARRVPRGDGRLIPLLASPPDDELRAARAYLVTPKLVGRDHVVARFRKQMMRAVRGDGGGFAVVGGEGTGRSRMLDAFALEAKLVGATAVRAGRKDALRPFGVAAARPADSSGRPSVALAAAMARPRTASVTPSERTAEPAGAALADLIPSSTAQRSTGRSEPDPNFSARACSPSRSTIAESTNPPPRSSPRSWRRGRAGSCIWWSTPREGWQRRQGRRIVRKHAEEVHPSPLTTDEGTAVLARSAMCRSRRSADPLRGTVRWPSARVHDVRAIPVDVGVITYAGGS